MDARLLRFARNDRGNDGDNTGDGRERGLMSGFRPCGLFVYVRNGFAVGRMGVLRSFLA
jgi:hypothetical protein